MVLPTPLLAGVPSPDAVGIQSTWPLSFCLLPPYDIRLDCIDVTPGEQFERAGSVHCILGCK